MKFRLGQSGLTRRPGLTLNLGPAEVEPFVLAAVPVLIPRYTQKLHFIRDAAREYPALEAMSKERPDFKMLYDYSAPSNVGNTFYIFDWSGSRAVILGGGKPRLSQDKWRELADELSALM